MKHVLLWVFLPFLFLTKGFTQTKTDTPAFKIIAAGPEYKKPESYQRAWGRNRRIEWTTPVRVPVLWIDKVYGGLTPYKKGGGNETRSLRLRSADGKEYSLRSINKSRDDVIAPQFKNTFVADIIKDGISMSHPYGAFGVSEMRIGECANE